MNRPVRPEKSNLVRCFRDMANGPWSGGDPNSLYVPRHQNMLSPADDFETSEDTMSALRISGTSFLLPSHKAWRSLDMTGDADFGEYGDWAAALMETPNNTPLVVCIFIEDLIGHYPSDVETAEAALSSILGLLETPVCGFSTHGCAVWQCRW